MASATSYCLPRLFFSLSLSIDTICAHKVSARDMRNTPDTNVEYSLVELKCPFAKDNGYVHFRAQAVRIALTTLRHPAHLFCERRVSLAC